MTAAISNDLQIEQRMCLTNRDRENTIVKHFRFVKRRVTIDSLYDGVVPEWI